jgi:hypothetical protein
MDINLLNLTAYTRRPDTTSDDGQGGFTGFGPVLVPSFQCRLRYLSGEKEEVYGQEVVKATHKLYCNLIDIIEADRVHIPTYTNGLVLSYRCYGVLHVYRIYDFDGAVEHLEVLLREIAGETT